MTGRQGKILSTNTLQESISEVNSFTYRYPIYQHVISWIDDYFNPDVLQNVSLLNQPIPQSLPQQSTCLLKNEQIQAQTSSFLMPVPTTKPIIKSIFHNFQKHLKTLLKKAITMRRKEVLCLPGGLQACGLWEVFKKEHNSSKRILYVIFGVEYQENQVCLKEAAEEIPQIRQILSRFPISEIQKAQKLLRQIVTDQILQLPMEKLKSLCKITRFDEFYIYFNIFMDELREGGISLRVTKVRKIRFLESSLPVIQSKKHD